MKTEIKIKNIISYTLLIASGLFILDFAFKPYNYIDISSLEKVYTKLHQKQKIAPQRLYINAWRIAKNEYVDKTMNNQNWLRWRNKYTKYIQTEEDAQVAINTMLTSLNDPYTKFLKSNNFAKEKIILDSKITGIGVIYNKTEEGMVIDGILKNSPAQKERIMPGDTILSIDDKSISQMSEEEIQKTIENAKGKKLKFAIKRGGEIIVKEIQSREIPLDTMKYRITEDNTAIVTLSNVMGEKAIKDFKTILEKTDNTKGLIIDLRNNYGGILANAVLMADLMIADGEILVLESRGKVKYRLQADKRVLFKNKPIVILVNSKTASAAEILAGTLRSNLNAVIIGSNTFGKNSIQHVIPMANKTGIIITSDKYLLPGKEDINKTGIKPDVEYINQGKSGHDELLEEAEKLINEVVKK